MRLLCCGGKSKCLKMSLARTPKERASVPASIPLVSFLHVAHTLTPTLCSSSLSSPFPSFCLSHLRIRKALRYVPDLKEGGWIEECQGHIVFLQDCFFSWPTVHDKVAGNVVVLHEISPQTATNPSE